MRNLPEWSVVFFAAALAGAVAVPLNAFWNGDELRFALDDCEAKVLVADGERFERLGVQGEALEGVALVGTRLDDRKTTAPLPAGIVPLAALLDRPAVRPFVAVEPDDLATIFYTSGTTSHPKGVLGTHRNMCANLVSLQFVAARGAMRAGLPPTQTPAAPPVILVPVPLFHGTGCHSNLVAQAWGGGTVVLMRRWDPEAALDLIEGERVTGVSGVPTMAWELVNAASIERRDLSSLRSLGGGGAAAPSELLRRIRTVLPGCGSGTGYGMTESSSLTTSIGGADYVARPTSVGVPVPICDVRIVDESGTDVPVGEVGEIWIKGPTVVPGYWRRPEETAQTFTDGWLHSGDLGRLDDEGFLYIVDRAKDMVIRGGENVSSIEVEGALFEHPAVLEAAVFSGPSPRARRGGGRRRVPATGKPGVHRGPTGPRRAAALTVQGARPHLAHRSALSPRRHRQGPKAGPEGRLHGRVHLRRGPAMTELVSSECRGRVLVVSMRREQKRTPSTATWPTPSMPPSPPSTTIPSSGQACSQPPTPSSAPAATSPPGAITSPSEAASTA